MKIGEKTRNDDSDDEKFDEKLYVSDVSEGNAHLKDKLNMFAREANSSKTLHSFWLQDEDDEENEEMQNEKENKVSGAPFFL